MSNGNKFVPPEAKKKQAASQQGFVPPEVKKKESGQLGLDGSVQPIVSPSTDTKLVTPETAQTAPLETIEDSLRYYQDIYGKDLGVGIRNKQYNQIVDTYNNRLKLEGTPTQKAQVFKNEAFNEYVKSVISKGVLTQEEADQIIAEEPSRIFEEVAKVQVTGTRNPLQEVEEEVTGMRPEDFGLSAVAETSTIPTPRYASREDIIKGKTAEEVEKVTETLKQNFIETLPEEQRNDKEALERIEENLWQDADIKLDLTGEGRFGEWKGGVFGELDLIKGALKGGTNALQTVVADALRSTPLTAVAGEMVAESRRQEMERFDKMMTQYEGGLLDNYRKGNYGAAVDQTLQMTGESLPLMAVAALSKNPYVGYAALSTLTAAEHELDIRSEDWYRELPPMGKVAYLGVYGGAEGFGEMVGGRVLKRAAKDLMVASKKQAAQGTLSDWARNVAKAYGINVREEGGAEMLTGITQYVADRVAQGKDITYKGLEDAALESLLGGVGMATVITTTGKAAEIPFLALNSINSKKSDKAIKKVKEAYLNSETEIERKVLSDRIQELQKVKEALLKEEGDRLNKFSDEDLNTYAENVTEFNLLQRQLDQLPEDSEAANVIKEKMQTALGNINELNEKYEQVTKTEEDAIQERETEEVPVGEEAEVGEEVVGEVREQTEEVRGEEEVTPERKAELENKQRAENIARKVVDPDFEQLSIEDQNFYEANQELVDSAIQEMQKTKPVEDTKVQSLAEKIVRGAKDFTDEEVDLYAARSEEVEAAKETIASEMEGQKTPPTPQKILGQTPSKTTKKVDMTDKAVVKQRIQDMVKAANEGYRAGKREVKGFAEEIDKVLKDIPKEADFTSQQTARIAKAAKGVTTPSQLNNFFKTAEKVIDDAQYATKLKTAEDNQTFIQKRGKSKNYPSNITKLFRDFANIDPTKVDDIDQYNFYAEEVRRIISKPKIVEGQVEETPQISIQEIREEYIDKHNTLSQDDLRNSLMEDYDFLPEDVKDMSPEEIQEIVDAIYSEEEVVEEPGENKNKGLEKLIDYKLIEIADIPTDNLTDAEKQQIEIITGADIQSLELSRKELGELYLYLQNYILNGQLNNISSVTAKIEARDAINNYLKEGVTPKEWITKIRGFAFGTMNMTQLYEAVGGSQDTGAKIYEVTNTYEYAEKKTEAENIFSGKIRDYAKKFKNSKVVENAKDRADRQIYGFLAQVPRDKYQQALEFIDNSIQYHEEGFAGFESKVTGEEIRSLFDEKYKGTSSIDQVKMSKSNMDIIDWMRNLFKEIKPEYFENAEIVHNRTLEEPVEEGKYLPFTSRKKGKVKVQEESIDNPSSLLDKVIIPNRSGATNKRENVFNPTDRYMTFDFERSMFSAYENQLLDIKTSYTIKKIAAFFRDPKSIDVFGSNELDRAFFNRTKEYVNNSFNSDSLGDLENSLFRVLNTLSNWSGRVALGGVDQAVKQSIPVLLNTSVNVGMTETFDALMDYNNPAARDTFKNSPVSRRSFVDQDTRKIYSNIPEADRKSAIGRIMKAFSIGDAKAEQIMMYAIQHSDKYAAQVSWLAYYKKKRGADFKGWDVEGKAPDKSASAFADLMISNTQNVNDIEQQASWLKVNQSESAGRWFSLVRKNSLPFISFKVNQIMDEVVQIGKLKSKPKEAVRRLGGRLGEQMAYVAFRKGIYALYGGAAAGLLSLLGIEPEDEEEKTEEEKTREWVAIAAEGVLGTTPFYGLSGYVDRKVGTGLNRYYYYNIMDDKTRDKYAGFGGRRSTRGMTEKDIKKKYERGFESFMKDKPPVFVRMKDSGGDFGMFSIGLDNHASDAKELYQSFLSLSTGEDYEYETMRGDYIELPLTEEEKKALIWLSILENTDYALPNDIAKIAGRSKREIFTKEFNEMFDTGR